MSEKEIKKYEFTGETKQIGIFGDITVRRIRATMAFGFVKIGDIGGWIEKEENLAKAGDAWVSGKAKVYGNAKVSGDAEVCGNAEVCGDAKVYGNAKVCGDAKVYGNAKVCGDAKVYGDAWVSGNAEVCGDAKVFAKSHLLVIGPVGSRYAHTTFYRDKVNEITVKCGCFLGKIDKFLEKVQQTHGDNKHAFVYRAAAEIAKKQIDLTDDVEEES